MDYYYWIMSQKLVPELKKNNLSPNYLNTLHQFRFHWHNKFLPCTIIKCKRCSWFLQHAAKQMVFASIKIARRIQTEATLKISGGFLWWCCNRGKAIACGWWFFTLITIGIASIIQFLNTILNRFSMLTETLSNVSECGLWVISITVLGLFATTCYFD